MDISTKPRVLIFTCTYCSYAAAEAAGISKLRYPPYVYIVRLPCSGMFKSYHVLKAFRIGFDAVVWSGCHPPYDCHFVNGNYKAQIKAVLLRAYLKQLGFEESRFRLEWIAAGEANKFADMAKKIVEDVAQYPKMKLVDLDMVSKE